MTESKMTDIQLDINNLVDRIPLYDVYNAPWDLIRKLESREIKDQLTELVNIQDQVAAGKRNDFAPAFLGSLLRLVETAFEAARTERKLSLMTSDDKRVQRYWKESASKDDTPLIEQSKRDRKEWEQTPEGKLWCAAAEEVRKEHGTVPFEEHEQLVKAKIKQMVSKITNGNYDADYEVEDILKKLQPETDRRAAAFSAVVNEHDLSKISTNQLNRLVEDKAKEIK